MNPITRNLLPAFVIVAAAAAQAAVPAWPRFRGPDGAGVADDAHPPARFGPGTNQLWKAEVPRGMSGPVVWGDRVFLTAFDGKALLTLAFDAATGRELWRRAAPATSIEPCHDFSSPAAPTPCTDGERVYAYFGSYGIVAYDFAGNEAWRRPFDRLPAQYGTATSPILAGGNLILQHDGDSTNSSLVALSPRTGKVAWESPRPLSGVSYSTPMTWRHDGKEELVVQGKGRVSGYDLSGGPQKWWVRGWGFSAVTTPVAGGGMLFAGGSGMGDPSGPPEPLFDWKKLMADYDANHDGKLQLDEMPPTVIWHIRKEIPVTMPGNGFPMRSMLEAFVDTDHDKAVTKEEWDASEAFANDKFNADRFVAIRPGGSGDATDTHVAWETTKGLSEMPSPLYYRGRVCFVRDGAMWTVVDPATGRRLVDRERIGMGGQFVASPVAADGRIYLFNAAGESAVLNAGDRLDVVCRASLGEGVHSTPAIAGNVLYVRTVGHLWAFGSPKAP